MKPTNDEQACSPSGFILTKVTPLFSKQKQLREYMPVAWVAPD